MKKHLLIILLLLFTIVNSCGLRKTDIKKPLKKYGDKYLVKQLDEHEFKFQTISAKFNTQLKFEKKNLSFSGQLRIHHDSLIWASISPALGIEAVRVKITPDSVFVIDRLNSTYIVSDFAYIRNAFGADIDFDIFQAMLLGNDMNYYENSVFKSGIENQLYKLNTLGRRKLKKHVRNETEHNHVLKQEILLNPNNFKIVDTKMNQFGEESKKIHMQYDNFIEIEDQLIPSILHLKIISDQKIQADIKYSRVKRNTELKFPFRVPVSYKKLVL